MSSSGIVQIATLRGSLTEPWDLAVRLFSLLNPGVHTELWWNGFRFLATDGGVQVYELDSETVDDDWYVVDVHVSDIDLALGFVDAALDSSADYGIDVLECALWYRSDDLDCCRPSTWDCVFCSQFVLLFLRWCDVHGLLGDVDARLFWSVNSKGCLPSRLEIILRRVFGNKP